jgi:hypothetical protein
MALEKALSPLLGSGRAVFLEKTTILGELAGTQGFGTAGNEPTASCRASRKPCGPANRTKRNE